MPYFTRVTPAGPIAGGINLPSPPPIVGTRVALMGRVSMGSITDSLRDWAGIPSQGSIAKAASYGLLGLGFWVGGAYLPSIWWPLKIGKAGLFVGGAWLLYRAIMNLTAEIKGDTTPIPPPVDVTPEVTERQSLEIPDMFLSAGYIAQRTLDIVTDFVVNEQEQWHRGQPSLTPEQRARWIALLVAVNDGQVEVIPAYDAEHPDPRE